MRSPKVMIDAGHGGRDQGSVWKYNSIKLTEADIVLTASQLLRLRLRSAGIQAHMTRRKNKRISQWKRAWKTAGVQADLLVSLHLDAYITPDVRGFAIYYCHKLLDSRLIARGIIENYLKLVELSGPFVLHGSGLYASDLGLFCELPMPVVVINLGFITNSEDLALLTLPRSLGLIVETISDYILSGSFRGFLD